MKNTLTDLNNNLFEQIERLNSDDLQGEELDKEIQRAKGITDLAQQIIASGNLAVKAASEGLMSPNTNLRLLEERTDVPVQR